MVLRTFWQTTEAQHGIPISNILKPIVYHHLCFSFAVLHVSSSTIDFKYIIYIVARIRFTGPAVVVLPVGFPLFNLSLFSFLMIAKSVTLRHMVTTNL